MAVFLAQSVGLVIAVGLLALSSEPMPGADALVWAGLAGASGALGLGAFYLALSRGTMGLVAPLTALLAATIPAVVGIATGEVVGPVVLAGMGAALAAVVLISLPDTRPGSPALVMLRGARMREWLLIGLAGLGFAAFFLGIDASHAAGGAVWWPLLLIKLAGTATIVVAAVALVPLGRLPAIRPARAALLMGSLAGLGDLGGNLFFVLASGEGDLAVVVVLASLYPVSTAILARLFLHERLGPIRMAGVGLAVAGVVLIGVGSV